ncbi:MAG: nicotinate-nucleotide adenylyltransferase [Candidatus Omnitrophica bacterium]|nr:nicotinate-nucleotide adenylyltransferase [Candidatus Omnitrophota bacterium]
MKIGILGGTFNPIHTGHLVLAQECWYALGLEKVLFVPASLPPHKEVEGGVSAADRLSMVKMALGHDPRFEISTYELDKGGISYTVDTLRHFHKVYGAQTDLFFIAGADAAGGLSTWREPDEVLKIATLVVVSRPGHRCVDDHGGKIKRIQMPSLDISSSLIRKRIEEKAPIDFLVPAPVVAYIRDKGFYRV